MGMHKYVCVYSYTCHMKKAPVVCLLVHVHTRIHLPILLLAFCAVSDPSTFS